MPTPPTARGPTSRTWISSVEKNEKPRRARERGRAVRTRVDRDHECPASGLPRSCSHPGCDSIWASRRRVPTRLRILPPACGAQKRRTFAPASKSSPASRSEPSGQFDPFVEVGLSPAMTPESFVNETSATQRLGKPAHPFGTMDRDRHPSSPIWPGKTAQFCFRKKSACIDCLQVSPNRYVANRYARTCH
jgi:hypothetical protein